MQRQTEKFLTAHNLKKLIEKRQQEDQDQINEVISALIAFEREIEAQAKEDAKRFQKKYNGSLLDAKKLYDATMQLIMRLEDHRDGLHWNFLAIFKSLLKEKSPFKTPAAEELLALKETILFATEVHAKRNPDEKDVAKFQANLTAVAQRITNLRPSLKRKQRWDEVLVGLYFASHALMIVAGFALMASGVGAIPGFILMVAAATSLAGMVIADMAGRNNIFNKPMIAAKDTNRMVRFGIFSNTCKSVDLSFKKLAEAEKPKAEEKETHRRKKKK